MPNTNRGGCSNAAPAPVRIQNHDALRTVLFSCLSALHEGRTGNFYAKIRPGQGVKTARRVGATPYKAQRRKDNP